MNIIITTKCNAYCDYCFAKEDSLNLIKSEMTLDEFKRVLYFSRSNNTPFQILGGEPTLHPDFKEMVLLAKKTGLLITIFTNGFVEPKIVDFLYDKGIDYVLNFSARKFIKEPKEKLNYFLERLGNRTMLGINYTHNFDRKEVSEISKTILKFDMIRTLRFGVSAPTYDLTNQFFDFNKENENFNSNLKELSKKLFKDGITISEDCATVPLCNIEDSTISQLKRFSGMNFFLRCNKMPVDILPGNYVIRCFPFSNFKVQLSNFKTVKSIRKYFSKLDYFLLMYAKPKRCLNCPFEGNICQSGCLINRFKLLKLLPKTKYHFSPSYYYSQTKDYIALLNLSDFNMQFIFEGTSNEILNFMIQGFSKEEVLIKMQEIYDVSKEELSKDFDDFIKNLRDKKILR